MSRIAKGLVAGAVALSVALPVGALAVAPPLRGGLPPAAQDAAELYSRSYRNVFGTSTMRGAVQGLRGDLSGKIKQEREEVRSEIKNMIGSSTEEVVTQLREKFQELMERQREEFKQAVEVKREEVKREIGTLRGELQNRIKMLKDARKEQVVMKIYDGVNALNGRMTDHFLSVLNQIDRVLSGVQSRADKAAANGREVSAVRSAIAAAEGAIASARTAVQTQAAKVYAVTVNASSTVRSDVGVARQALHADLTAVRELVKGARDAVRQAAVALAQIPRVDEETSPAATSTPAATTTATSAPQL